MDARARSIRGRRLRRQGAGRHRPTRRRAACPGRDEEPRSMRLDDGRVRAGTGRTGQDRSPSSLRLYDALVDMQADRRTVVVAVGGGVVGDTAGFAAATYARGHPLRPGSDDAAGASRQFGRRQGRRQPSAGKEPDRRVSSAARRVYRHGRPSTTLPDRDYRSGLAEVVKYGVILDGEFFDYLEGTCRRAQSPRSRCAAARHRPQLSAQGGHRRARRTRNSPA